jgi:hypothetical protein
MGCSVFGSRVFVALDCSFSSSPTNTGEPAQASTADREFDQMTPRIKFLKFLMGSTFDISSFVVWECLSMSHRVEFDMVTSSTYVNGRFRGDLTNSTCLGGDLVTNSTCLGDLVTISTCSGGDLVTNSTWLGGDLVTVSTCLGGDQWP